MLSTTNSSTIMNCSARAVRPNCSNSCSKSGNNSNTPISGYANVSINFSYPQYSALNAVNGWIYIPQSPNGGVRGIILYRSAIDQFLAFERSCTYNTNNECGPLTVDKTGTVIQDTCKNCGSQFLIQSGQVKKGPASIPLLQYKTSFDGNTTVTITN